MPDELDGTFAGREAIHFSVSAAGPPDGSPSCRDSRPFASIRGWSTASLLKPRQSTQSLTRNAGLLSTLYNLWLLGFSPCWLLNGFANALHWCILSLSLFSVCIRITHAFESR